jgi:hypothetical protein
VIAGMSYAEAWDHVFRGSPARDVALWAQQMDVAVGECVAKFWDETVEDAYLPGGELDFADLLTEARLDHEDRMVREVERELNWATSQAYSAVNGALRSVEDRIQTARLLLSTSWDQWSFLGARNDRLYVWQLCECLRRVAHQL